MSEEWVLEQSPYHILDEQMRPKKVHFEEYVRYGQQYDSQLIVDHVDGVEISTWFVGLAENWTSGKQPFLFETVIVDRGELVGKFMSTTYHMARNCHETYLALITESYTPSKVARWLGTVIIFLGVATMLIKMRIG